MNILNLTIKNSYAHKNTTIKFEEGVNYILGKNESGKSEALEMIAYALFGTSALRTAASEYKTLEVTMTFKVGSSTYIVDRSKKTTLVEVIIDKDGTKIKDIAVSKTAVNIAIIDLLGYNLDVYNKLNFSKQLEGSAFATTNKSGRLDLINKINGVDEANLLETFLDKKKKSLKSEIKGLNLTDKLKDISFTPNRELDKLGSDALQNLSKQSVELFSEITLAEKIITAHNMIPVLDIRLQQEAEDILLESFLHPTTGVKQTLEEHIKVIKDIKNQSELLKQQFIREQQYIDKHAVYSHNGGFIQSHEVEDAAAIHANNKIYAQKEALLAKGEISCPHCLANFPLMTLALEAFKDINYLYSDYTEEDVRKGKVYIEMHEETVLSYFKNQWELKDQIAKLERVAPLYDVKALDIKLNVIHRNNQQQYNYKFAIEQFNKQFSNVVDMTELQKTLDKNKQVLNELSAKRTEIEIYQKEQAVYNSAKDAQEKLEAFVQERTKKIDAFENLIQESKRIKLEIQNNCIPTLNKKASQVINKMTGGEHFSLTLSDTFELLLDGKAISAYSGSAQVTANVAFRVALIEMFYKKTFPLFIGDEIDSFADSTRASHIHESLKVLSEDGYQVILISHHALSFEGNIIDLNTLKK